MKTKKKTKLNSLRDSRLGGLRVLFKEVLQQIPPDDVEKLRKGYMEGKQIFLLLRQSKGGSGCKTAFSYALGENVQIITPVTMQGGNALVN
jgi:hypothetical protein